MQLVARLALALSLSFSALAVGACGPSAGQVKAAREARYDAELSVAFKAVVDAVSGEKYKVVQADAATGAVVTEPRWYEPDGTFEDKSADGSSAMLEHGSVMLAYEIRLYGENNLWQVAVIPRAQQYREGSPMPHALPPDDPGMPGWVIGKTDELYLAIHAKLKPYQVAPPQGQLR